MSLCFVLSSFMSRSLPWISSPEASRHCRARHTLLAALSLVLFVITIAKVLQICQFPVYKEPDTTFSPLVTKRLGVVNFVDSNDYYLWGVYSIHKQMKKFHMTPQVSHIALVASDISNASKALLVEWLGRKNVREIDVDVVRKRVPDGVWVQVFSKIEAFNVTDFDKLIVLDNDIFIRQNIMHWFDYPAPAATQARGSIEWNSGAMVIEPSTRLYNKLLEYIPKTRLWKPEWDDGHDTWNSGRGHQGFLSSFFLSNVTKDSMFTMSYGASVLSSDLTLDENRYFWKYRNNAIETKHFTLKPWLETTRPRNPALCAMFREWLESVADAPQDRMKPLPNFLRNCPPAENAEDRKREEMLKLAGTLGLRNEDDNRIRTKIRAKERVDAKQIARKAETVAARKGKVLAKEQTRETQVSSERAKMKKETAGRVRRTDAFVKKTMDVRKRRETELKPPEKGVASLKRKETMKKMTSTLETKRLTNTSREDTSVVNTRK